MTPISFQQYQDTPSYLPSPLQPSHPNSNKLGVRMRDNDLINIESFGDIEGAIDLENENRSATQETFNKTQNFLNAAQQKINSAQGYNNKISRNDKIENKNLKTHNNLSLLNQAFINQESINLRGDLNGQDFVSSCRMNFLYYLFEIWRKELEEMKSSRLSCSLEALQFERNFNYEPLTEIGITVSGDEPNHLNIISSLLPLSKLNKHIFKSNDTWLSSSLNEILDNSIHTEKLIDMISDSNLFSKFEEIFHNNINYSSISDILNGTLMKVNPISQISQSSKNSNSNSNKSNGSHHNDKKLIVNYMNDSLFSTEGLSRREARKLESYMKLFAAQENESRNKSGPPQTPEVTSPPPPVKRESKPNRLSILAENASIERKRKRNSESKSRKKKKNEDSDFDTDSDEIMPDPELEDRGKLLLYVKNNLIDWKLDINQPLSIIPKYPGKVGKRKLLESYLEKERVVTNEEEASHDDKYDHAMEDESEDADDEKVDSHDDTTTEESHVSPKLEKTPVSEKKSGGLMNIKIPKKRKTSASIASTPTSALETPLSSNFLSPMPQSHSANFPNVTSSQASNTPTGQQPSSLAPTPITPSHSSEPSLRYPAYLPSVRIPKPPEINVEDSLGSLVEWCKVHHFPIELLYEESRDGFIAKISIPNITQLVISRYWRPTLELAQRECAAEVIHLLWSQFRRESEIQRNSSYQTFPESDPRGVNRSYYPPLDPREISHSFSPRTSTSTLLSAPTNQEYRGSSYVRPFSEQPRFTPPPTSTYQSATPDSYNRILPPNDSRGTHYRVEPRSNVSSEFESRRSRSSLPETMPPPYYSQDRPERPLERVPERHAHERSQDRYDHYSQDYYQERNQERVPERVSERIPERIPERIAERIPERLSDRIPERIPERSLDRSHDRYPERHSSDRITIDRHAQDRYNQERRRYSPPVEYSRANDRDSFRSESSKTIRNSNNTHKSSTGPSNYRSSTHSSSRY